MEKLYQKIKSQFFVTDVLIEEKSDLLIVDIFKNLDEASFKLFEAEVVEVIKEVSKEDLVVILCAGVVLSS
ncbi:MAG: hypothetical protein Nk1A_7460 [Endomicrobiia bacterium]|nr:MAG: hypothetical protein Nk1A_7460 [Endomicrobiia bacterium]